jgi:hypothetical protein
MGLQAVDPELAAAKAGARVVTPSGMVLDGTLDRLEGPPATRAEEDPDKDGIANEIPLSSSTTSSFTCSTTSSRPRTRSRRAFIEAERFSTVSSARAVTFRNLTIRDDRRVADVETAYDADRGLFNNLFRDRGASVPRRG